MLSTVESFACRIQGRIIRIARLQNEWYEFISHPSNVADNVKGWDQTIDLFTFLPEISSTPVAHPYYSEPESVAVIPVTTYENWWTRQSSDKTRNMARKAGKKGIEIRVARFDDDFIRGIMAINDESPVRQGMPYWHYRKDFESVRREHASFLEESEFIGAYLGAELVGYVKLVHGNGKSSIMQILSKIAHRDKAPNNALVAKCVEICAQRKVPFLHYATWSRRGLGDFKISHGFQRFDIPRYYIPINTRGALFLKVGFHRPLKDHLPDSLKDFFAVMRQRWYSLKYSTVP